MIHNLSFSGKASQGFRLVIAGEDDVSQREEIRDDSPRLVQRPEIEAQVGVVRNKRAIGPCDLCRPLDGGAHGRADGLGERRDMQDARLGNRALRQIVRAIEARCRPAPGVGKAAASGIGHHEVRPCRILGAYLDMGTVDTLTAPERQEFLAKRVAADSRQVAAARSLPGRGDDGIRRVATKALAVDGAPVDRVGKAHELDQGFAKGKNPGGVRHRGRGQ